MNDADEGRLDEDNLLAEVDWRSMTDVCPERTRTFWKIVDAAYVTVLHTRSTCENKLISCLALANPRPSIMQCFKMSRAAAISEWNDICLRGTPTFVGSSWYVV